MMTAAKTPDRKRCLWSTPQPWAAGALEAAVIEVGAVAAVAIATDVAGVVVVVVVVVVDLGRRVRPCRLFHRFRPYHRVALVG